MTVSNDAPGASIPSSEAAPAAAVETPVSTGAVASDTPPPVETAAPAPDATVEPPVAAAPEQTADEVANPADAPAETPQPTEPAPLPSFEPFNLPEGFEPNETLSTFTADLAEFTQKTGVDPALMQEFGQQLVDKYAAQTQSTIEALTTRQADAWKETTSGWKTALESDPELGGNRLETTAQGVRQAVEKYAGNAEQMKEFREFMDTYHVGNHPSLVRLINNMHTKLLSYETETAAPISAQALSPKSKSMVEKFYGKSMAG